MKLSRKINIIFVVAILLPVLLISMFFYVNIRELFSERAEDNLKYLVDKKAEYVNKLIDDSNEIATSVGISDMLQTVLQGKYYDYEEFYKVYSNPVTNFVQEIVAVNSGISEMYIYTDNPDISKTSVYINFSEEPYLYECHKKLKEEEKNVCVLSGTEQGILLYYVISPVRFDYVYDMGVSVRINMKQISDWLGEDDDTTYYFVNDNNEILVSTGANYIASDEDSKYYVNKASEDTLHYECIFEGKLSGYKLIAETSNQQYVKQFNTVSIIAFLLVVCMIVVSAYVLYSITAPYSRRLASLSKHMRGFDIENIVPISTKYYNDEVEVVISSFNYMLGEINRLINEVYALNMEKKELEINQVQAQMNQLISQVNPHFIFNTLNAILTIGERNNYTEVNWCISHLSKMMRNLLDWSEDMIEVEKEVAFIRMYLEIEKLRFAELFEYDIVVGDDADRMYIPKMSIQPLVENACKHGLHKQSGVGRVVVSVNVKENMLCVTVEDNGSHLSKEDILYLKETFLNEEQKEQGHIGLKNVYGRLKLYYGDNAEFVISANEKYNVFGFNLNVKDEGEYEEGSIGG